MKKLWLFLAVVILTLAGPPSAQAEFLTSPLGNTSPGFNAGDVIDVFQLIAAQSGQPVPFNAGIGSDPIENFSTSWTHSFSPLAEVLSASISIGIYDNDSATAGDQLASFSVGGIDLTSQLNALFEAPSPGNGQNSQYNVYNLILPASVYPALKSGTVPIILALKGPTFSPGLPGITDDTFTSFNGAAVIFSRLDIQVPEPSPLVLLMSGGLSLTVALRWKKSRRSAA